jgi:hypothetical protein
MDDGNACNACIGGDYDGDTPEFFSETISKARKAYQCCECQTAILVGTSYERATGKWDGALSVYRTCLPCVEIRVAFCCNGWTYGQLWESAAEGFFEVMTTGCLTKLKTSAAKEKLLSEWRAWKFDS